MIQRNDEEHLEFAAKTGRVLYSFNVADFYDLHSRYLSVCNEHAGSSLRASSNSQSASNYGGF
jgi:hypothetical protein